VIQDRGTSWAHGVEDVGGRYGATHQCHGRDNLRGDDRHMDNIQQQEARQRQKIQQQLDEALADSFPASDPVSIVTSHAEEDWGERREGAAQRDEPCADGERPERAQPNAAAEQKKEP